MAATLSTTAAQICAAVRACFPQLQDATVATDRECRVTAEGLSALRAAGGYRMLVPAALRGTLVGVRERFI